MNAKRRQKVRTLLLEAQDGRCCYCGIEMMVGLEGRKRRARAAGITTVEFRYRLATFEHLRRRCEGGTARLDNLALACSRCNGMRGEKNWCEFKSIMARAA